MSCSGRSSGWRARRVPHRIAVEFTSGAHRQRPPLADRLLHGLTADCDLIPHPSEGSVDLPSSLRCRGERFLKVRTKVALLKQADQSNPATERRKSASEHKKSSPRVHDNRCAKYERKMVRANICYSVHFFLHSFLCFVTRVQTE